MAEAALRQNEKKRNRPEKNSDAGDRIIASSSTRPMEDTTMKTWIKRTLIGLTGSTLLLGSLAGCAWRGHRDN